MVVCPDSHIESAGVGIKNKQFFMAYEREIDFPKCLQFPEISWTF